MKYNIETHTLETDDGQPVATLTRLATAEDGHFIADNVRITIEQAQHRRNLYDREKTQPKLIINQNP